MRLRQVKRTKKRVNFSVLQDDEHIGEALVEKTKGGWLWFATYWDPGAKKELTKEGSSVDFDGALQALKSAVPAGWDADRDIIDVIETTASRKPASRKPASKRCPTCGGKI